MKRMSYQKKKYQILSLNINCTKIISKMFEIIQGFADNGFIKIVGKIKPIGQRI